MDLLILDISCKWHHTIGALFWLASFSEHNVFKVYACFSVCQHFIPRYGWRILYDDTTSGLFTHQLMDVWVVSTFWLLWTMLLWTFMYKSVCVHRLPILLDIIWRTRWSYGETVTLWGTQTIFQTSCTMLSSRRQYVRSPNFPHPPQNLLFVFHILAILAGVKWYLTVVLILTSIITNDVERLSIWCCQFVHLL